MACYSEAFGWFNSADDCYYRLRNPQPPDGVEWEGHYPDGAIYVITCLNRIPGSNGGWVWLPAPPPGYGAPVITPRQLADRAVEQLGLAGAAIRMSIEGDALGTVGIPVWLWTEVSPSTWGPVTATASVPGLSVTATAQARLIVWDTGDGATETCTGPGTPYAVGLVVSTCQHVYEQSSAGQPGDAWPVTATTTWAVTWSGGGQSGSIEVTRTASSSVRVGEVQVLITR